MQRSIATTTLPGHLGEKLQAAAAAGFDGVEIFENDLLYFDRPPAEVRRMATDLGLSIIALQPFRDFEALPEPRRARAFDRAGHKFELMGELGTDTLLICSSVSEHALDDPARAAADLAELAERAAHHGIRIGYEALAWGRHVRDYPQAWSVVRAADQPNLGLVLDTFHLFVRGNRLDTLADIPPDKITLVQLADAPDMDMDVLELSRHFRCFPGEGSYPIVEFMLALRAIGYQGAVSHEIFSDEFRSASPAQIARDGMRSMLWLEEQVERAATPLAAAPAGEDLVNGFEFLEFAAEGGEAAWLAQALESLGFRRTHRHRSKDVSLYRQGEVNFIINREPDSFAHSYEQRHGTSVCALGIGTPEPGRLVERARRFRCFAFTGKISRDELDIPAVRGIDGGLVYFVERRPGAKRFFEVDFEALSDEEPAGFGIECVDHVVQALSTAEFLSSQLFYRVLLELQPQTEFDIVDPHGIVTSRIVQSRDGAVCIPLNTSFAHESSTQRFRTRYAGSGVQQIALRCADIFAVAERLNPRNVLPMPENYYEDLDARHDLDPALLERLRRHNVLYDEIDGGRLFQLFTRQINGLFFEILQRDGYTRFGEANASARLAAQAREYERIRTLAPDYERPAR